MTNTEYLFNAMRKFQDARSTARAEYLATMKKYASAQGSPYYTEQQEKAAKTRREAVEAAKADALGTVNNALSCMRSTSSKRGMTPPTEEQLRILQMLKMRKTVSPAELQAAANSMDGNGAALQVIQEIAQEQGHTPRSYVSMSTDGLPAAAAQTAIDSLAKSCGSILADSVGANKGARLSAEHSARIHGTEFNPDDLPQEAPWANEREFYASALPFTDYEVFAKAVN